MGHIVPLCLNNKPMRERNGITGLTKSESSGDVVLRCKSSGSDVPEGVDEVPYRPLHSKFSLENDLKL